MKRDKFYYLQIYGFILFVVTSSWAVNRKCEENRRFYAKEANQAVAVDDQFIYAIGTTEIGKYNKESGAFITSLSNTPFGCVCRDGIPGGPQAF